MARTRTGVPILPEDQDFERLFGLDKGGAGEGEVERPSRGKVKKKPAEARTPESAPSREAHVRRDRHGIPVLDDESDWYGLFDVEAPGPGDREPAVEALAAADRRILERKMAGRPTDRRKKGVLQRIRNYPPAQGQLDLHGYTAGDAARRAESFLINARHAGRLTLRIIVGRGLHSSGEAVLPGVVEDVVVELKQRGVVLTYRWEKRRRADSGSVTVFIDPPE